MSAQTGFIVKATSQSDASLHTMALRVGYDELVADVAHAFGLIPSSVTLLSQHNGTKLWVHMGSQGDLDVVLAEAVEWGSHVISVEASGVSSNRALDAVGCLAATVSTISQLFYLQWIIGLGSDRVGFYRELEVWIIMGFALVANLGGFGYLLDDETSHNHPFRQWVRPLFKRLLMFAIAPFSGDVLALVGCGTCGLNAPIRSSTREGVVKWGVVMMVLQDGMMLSVLAALHGEEGGEELSDVPRLCLYATLASLLINLPRRISHFLVGACESAFREREELADDAQISMFANQKMAAAAPPTQIAPAKGQPARSRSPGGGGGAAAGKGKGAAGAKSKGPKANKSML